MKEGVLACDLGASTGRIMFVSIKNNILKLEEIHRFKNEPYEEEGKLKWDLKKIISNIEKGIVLAAKKNKILSMGIDSWGVDYGWLDKKDLLLQDPYCYRDERVNSVIEEVHTILSKEYLFKETGNIFFKFNTLYQLYYDLKKDKNIIENGKQVLFIPDLIGFHFSGNKVTEYSIASTSGLMDQRKRVFNLEIMKKLNILDNIFPKLVEPENILGEVKIEIQKKLNINSFKIINVNSHDTASALSCMKIENSSSIFLINGTWSILGTISKEIFDSEISYENKITNEGLENKNNRILRMTPGTWILQRLKLDFEKNGKNYSYEEMANLAKKSYAQEHVDLEDEKLVFPISMMNIIKKIINRKNEVSDSDIIKIAYNSIIFKYFEIVKSLEKVLKRKIIKIIVLGGGIQDSYLMNRISKELNIELIKGPVEASALGNSKVQFFALNKIKTNKEWEELVNIYLIENC